MEEVIDKLYEVGEIHPFDAKGVRQGKIWEEGNDYLHREFPKVRLGLYESHHSDRSTALMTD